MSTQYYKSSHRVRFRAKRLWWIAALRAKGHQPRMVGGDLDTFTHEVGLHNGPGCATCGWSCCWHCDDVSVIPDCEGGRDGQ